MILTAPAESFTDVREIPLDELVPFAQNPRSDLGDLDGLVASIYAVGIIEPLVVAANGPHGYTVVAGHRRLAAARLAGLATAPCIHRGFASTAEMIELTAIENLQREGLSPLDEARAMQALVDLGRTQREIAERIGCNQSHVSRRLSLVHLPDAAAKMLVAGDLQLRQAEELAELPDDDVDEVVAIVGKRHGGDGGVADWEISSAITRITRDRKHAKALEAGKASGLKKLKDNPRWGSREFEKCKKAEATHWYLGDHESAITWARKRADATEDGKPAKSEWEIRREREEAEIARRQERLQAIVAGDIDRARTIGIEVLVAKARDNYDRDAVADELGITDDHMDEIEADPVLFLALLAIADTVNEGLGEPRPYEWAASTRARDLWTGLLAEEPAVVDLGYGGEECGSEPDEVDPLDAAQQIEDGDAAWAADRGFEVAPDAAEVQADLNDAPEIQVSTPETCSSDDEVVPDWFRASMNEPAVRAEQIHNRVTWENPAWLQSGPWPGYRVAKVEALITRIGKVNDVDKVRRVIAYEWAGKGLRRDDILAAALGRLGELQP